MHLGKININATKSNQFLVTFQWWRTLCSQDLLGWKECRSFQYWMDKESLTNIKAKCFFFNYHISPHSNFQLSELPTC